ncbi:hypothetical protein EDD21DRAFT_174117 [Dissophora ornata]|nr:hypothetical protein EDD21DRAFT_174117 [Dissophora ornata]
MDNKQSGMVTPPIVSPRPIQTQKALSADENWKVVGSPPRRPLMSPPEERERNRVLQENDITTVEGNRNKALATAIGADLVDLADSTISSISGGTFNESSSSSSTASSTSSPASPTVPQHKQPVHRILSGQDLRQGSLVTQITSGDHRTTGFVSTKGISPFDQYSLLDEAPPQPLHYKSSSTGALNDRHLEAASFSLLGDHGVGPGESFHSKSQSLNSVGRGAGVTRGGLRQSGGGLESPLNFSPFIWNGRPAKDSNDLPATTATNSNSNSLNTSGPGFSRPGRSLSFSDSGFSSAFGLSSAKLALDQDDEDVLRYRPPLPTMEEESEDTFEPRMSRARSFSTSAALGSSAFPGGLSGSAFSSAGSQDPFSMSSGSFGGSSLMLGNEGQLPPNRKPPGVSAWPSSTNADTATLSHRRSVTSNSAFNTPVWESHGPFQPLPPPVERDLHGDRQRVARRFSLAPASGFQNYDAFLDDIDAGNSSTLGSFNR